MTYTPAAADAPARLLALRDALLAWYRANRRDLPWRRRKGDAYAVWISEVMLQQTRVDTVVPYYERFLARWPTVADLAAADPEEVRASWSGLGYYRRAKLMMDAARAIVAEHGGALPGDVDALLALPSFGRYTAGAVASIAFDRPAPAVDGNVSRVLARIGGVRGDVSRGAPNREVWSLASSLSPGAHAGDLSQALIELGALVCTPRAPRCDACPAAPWCTARREGTAAEIPPPKKRSARGVIEVTALVAVRGDRVVLEKRPAEGLFANLWCVPLLDARLDSPDAVADEAERRFAWPVSGVELVAEVKHVLTHRDIRMRVARVESATAIPPGMKWTAVGDLPALGIPSFTARTLKAALPSGVALPGRAPRLPPKSQR